MAKDTWNFKRAEVYTQRLLRHLARLFGVANTCVLCHYPTNTLDELLCEVCLEDLEKFELGYDFLLQNPKDVASLESKYITGLALIGEYVWPFSQFIPSLKFHRGVIHAKWLGRLLEQQIYHQIWPVIDKIIPVPLHPFRQFKRGYNQAQLICQHMALYQNKIDLEVLYRQVRTQPQTKLSKQQRKRNVADAFVCKQDLTGLTVLLVDDVITTGNTVNQAAKILLEKGATAVYVAAVAIRKLS